MQLVKGTATSRLVKCTSQLLGICQSINAPGFFADQCWRLELHLRRSIDLISFLLGSIGAARGGQDDSDQGDVAAAVRGASQARGRC